MKMATQQLDCPNGFPWRYADVTAADGCVTSVLFSNEKKPLSRMPSRKPAAGSCRNISPASAPPSTYRCIRTPRRSAGRSTPGCWISATA